MSVVLGAVALLELVGSVLGFVEGSWLGWDFALLTLIFGALSIMYLRLARKQDRDAQPPR